MANRCWANNVTMAGVHPEEFSYPGSRLCPQSKSPKITSQRSSRSKKQSVGDGNDSNADPNVTCQTSNRSKKRSICDGNDSNATKADEKRPEMGVPVGTCKRSICDGNDSNATKADEKRSEMGVPVGTCRPRGRPKGSKNKSKAPLSENPEALETLENRIFEIASGLDIKKTLEKFALKSQLGIFIFSGSGAVTNVTLMQQAAPGGTVTYSGPLGILSLSGVIHPASGAARITVILADGHGMIIAGEVTGSLVASDLVTVVTGVAPKIPYERLNVKSLEVQPLRVFKSLSIPAANKHNE